MCARVMCNCVCVFCVRASDVCVCARVMCVIVCVCVLCVRE